MLKLNIGVSKKIGEANYGSRGASASVELEAETALLEEPGKLQERVRHLFRVVRSAVDDELRGSGTQEANGTNGNGQAANGNGSNGHASGAREATQSQVLAIYAIASRNGRDLTSLLWDRFNRQKPESLSIKEASQLIDELKSANGAETRQ